MQKSISAVSGVLYLTLSKFVFIVTGYIVYISLARYLGPELFGTYGIVVGIVSVLNMVLITGTIQSVSKFISEEPALALDVRTQGLKLQAIIGGIIAVSYFFSADIIASLLKDPTLVPLLRLSSLIPLFYSLYAVFIGYINGQKQFRMQALFDITFSVLKCSLILLLVFLGFSITGAIFGFASAAGIILILSASIIGFRFQRHITFPMKKIFIFGFIISLFTASSNLLLTLDLLLIKSLIVENYVKLYTGYYTAVQTIARIPFFLMVPINLVLFPIISRSTFSQNNEETRYYINNGLRYNLAIMTLIVVLISSSSKEIILIIYSKEYLPAWSSLTVLSVGMLFYSLLITSSTIISSSGKPKISLIILVIVLISDLILNYVLIPKYELIGASISTSLASLLGLFIAAGYVLCKFNAFMTFKSITRITISGILIYFIANKIHASGFMLLVEMMCMSALYFLLLLVSREISKQDIASLKGVFKIRNV